MQQAQVQVQVAGCLQWVGLPGLSLVKGLKSQDWEDVTALASTRDVPLSARPPAALPCWTCIATCQQRGSVLACWRTGVLGPKRMGRHCHEPRLEVTTLIMTD